MHTRLLLLESRELQWTHADAVRDGPNSCLKRELSILNMRGQR